MHVVIPVVYGLIYHGCQPISIHGANHPVYNAEYLALSCNSDSYSPLGSAPGLLLKSW